MPRWATDPLTWWTLLVFAIGFLLGKSMDALLSLWDAFRGDHTDDLDRLGDHTSYVDVITPEVELFITTTPDAFPPGKVWQEPIDRTEQVGGDRWRITRLDDLGSFPDIYGKRHQQWRVYGRPA